MACQKGCKQGRDDESNGQHIAIGKPHPYIFFTLQVDSACESS